MLDEEIEEGLRCSRCLMPFSAPGVYPVDGNVCNVCKEYKPVKILGEKFLFKRLENNLSKGGKYQCIVPVSGGLDSLYTAYYLVRRMGLKCLGVHYDNDFSTDSCRYVLNWIESVLKMPIVYKSVPKDIVFRVVREGIRSFLKFGPGSMQVAICHHCGYGIRASVFSEMALYNIHSIWGMHTLDTVPFRYCKDVNSINYFFQEHWYEALKFILSRYKQVTELPSPGESPLRLMFRRFGYPSIPSSKHHHLEVIRFYDYVKWDKKRMLEELQSEGLNIEFFEHAHTDCLLSPVVEHILRSAWSVGKEEVYVCNLVRDGQITIEDGKELIGDLKKNTLDINILRDIGLKDYEIDMIFRRTA